MRVRLKIPQVGAETGALLKDYLELQGVTVTTDKKAPVVCYGKPTDRRPALNGTCGGGKIRNMLAMEKAGVRTVPYFIAGFPMPNTMTFPLLARRLRGHGGQDIAPVFQPEEIPWRIAAGWEWFSQYLPVETELRIWVFRDKLLGAYEKVMRRPENYVNIGRNFANGFDFTPIPAPIEAYKLAVKSIRAIGYDFAAVDMLEGKDGLLYVLETNTAPGALRSGAQGAVKILALCIKDWVKGDCPKWDTESVT